MDEYNGGDQGMVKDRWRYDPMRLPVTDALTAAGQSSLTGAFVFALLVPHILAGIGLR